MGKEYKKCFQYLAFKISYIFSHVLQGTVAHSWFSEIMVNTVGHREAELALQLGKLYSPSEALSVGLVDKLVEPTQMASTVNETMTQWLQIPGMCTMK